MLVLTQLFLHNISYDFNYSLKTHMQLPQSNGSLRYFVANDFTNQKQYHHFFNDKDQQIDAWISDSHDQNNQTAVQKRVHVNYEECVRYKHSKNFNYLPDVTQYILLGNTTLNGQVVVHLRQTGEYSNQSINSSYLSTENYQHDFYCRQTSQYCIPVRWEQHGRSNFYSQFSIYILDYSDFETKIDEQLFNETRLCENVSIIQTNKPISNQNLFYQHQTMLNNLQLINDMNNNKDFTFKVAPNQFVFQDLENRKHFFRNSKNKPQCNFENITTIPDKLDWRIRGALTPVKDQNFCGSCWTFSITSVIETKINMLNSKNDIQTKLSEQSIVDCYWSDLTQGCEGGEPFDALVWMRDVQKSVFALNDDYTYLGQNDYCKNDSFKLKNYEIKEVCQVAKTIDDVKKALTKGPVAVAVNVPLSFHFYVGGVYNDPACNSNQLEHAVTIVGWGNDNEAGEYWVVRNSWSTLWGLDGYMYISTKNNLCGILEEVVFADVQKK